MSNTATKRLISIDALRGLVILLMLLDHVRETFYLHMQVSDPIDVENTSFLLFFSRSLAHICAPVFIFLAGLSAALYATKVQSTKAVSNFLWKRGLFLIILEITVINFAWTFQFPPHKIFLQVIWAIGISMIALSVLVWLPRRLLLPLAIVIIVGHNLLDQIHFSAESMRHVPWAILHDRGWLEITAEIKARTSYPVLPWIGIITLGFCAAPLFGKTVSVQKRCSMLYSAGGLLIAAFFLLRFINIYGEKPWPNSSSFTESVMNLFNITKYPPSLAFTLITLGIGAILLASLEKADKSKMVHIFSVFGSVPMFFYVLHLYVLKFLYLGAVAIWGLNKGDYFGFDSMVAVWICTIILAVVLYFPVRAFSRFKQNRRDLVWLKYF